MSRADRATFPDPSGRPPAPNTLTAILGHNDEPWMSHPERNCQSDSTWPDDIRAHADRWFVTSPRPGAAEELCAGCPVKAECREWGMANPGEWGVLGGLTARRRREIRAAARTGKRGAA